MSHSYRIQALPNSHRKSASFPWVPQMQILSNFPRYVPPFFPFNDTFLQWRFKNLLTIFLALLVHHWVWHLQRGRRIKSLWSWSSVRFWRAQICTVWQTRTTSIWGWIHCGAGVPGRGLPAHLLCVRELRRRQGQAAQLLEEDRKAVRGPLQPVHPVDKADR